MIFNIGGGPPAGPPPGGAPPGTPPSVPPAGSNVVGLLRPDRDYQREAIDRVFGDWNNGQKSLLLVLPCGCHRAGERVMRYDGSDVAVEDVSVGDHLMGPDSSPRTVLALCRGTGRMMRVTPTKGRVHFVNDEHVLSLNVLTRGPEGAYWYSEVVDMTVNSYLECSRDFKRSARLRRVSMRKAKRLNWDGDPDDQVVKLRDNDFDMDPAFEVATESTNEPYYGFTLDGDQRYLADDYTVFHNSGKTIVSADIIRRCVQQTSQKTIFMAHRAELLTQSRDKIRLVAPQLSVGIVQAQHDDTARQVTVASVQTLMNATRLQRVLQHGPYSLLVIDECHHAASPSYMKVIDIIRRQNPSIRILGLTATPGRADGLGLSDLFEKISYTKSTLELIEEKWLVYPRAFRVNLNIDLDVIGTKAGDGDKDLKDGDLAKLLIQQPVLDATFAAYQQYGDGRTMIGFSVTVEHARLLAETFTRGGVNSSFVSGDTKHDDRQVLYADFRSGKLRVLFSCSVLTEGFDEPSAGGVLLARPTMSQSLFIQMVGRGLRPYPMKTECIVIDCAGNTKKHAIVQMSTLAGFEQFDAMKPEKDTIPREIGDEREVVAHGTDMYGNEVRITDIRGSTRESTYSWRQTDYGYALMIPKVGYYLVANDKGDPTTANIRYYDTRKTADGRPAPAVSITEKPIDCNLAYGLVESEAKRILRAAMRAANEKRPTSSQHPDKQLSFDAHLTKVVDNLGPLLIDGIDDESIDDHILMSRTARWRDGPRTEAQTKLLTKLGTKVDNMPATAGEASDLISIATVEKHQKSVKMHGDPATPKQRWFLRINNIPHDADVNKAEAAKLIFVHRMKLKSSSH